MGWGSKQTTTGTNSSTATNSNTTTPNLNPLAQSLYSSTLFPQARQLIANANKPVYGDAQKASVLNDLNGLAQSASRHLNSSLASRGALGSGDFDTGQAGIEQQRYGNLSNFYSQLPSLEDQAHQQKMLSALGFGAGLAGQMPVGQTSIGNQTQSGTQQQTQTSNPGFSGLVGSLLGSVGSAAMGGFGNMMSGGPGGFSGGFGQVLSPSNPFNMAVPYGGMNFSPSMRG